MYEAGSKGKEIIWKRSGQYSAIEKEENFCEYTTKRVRGRGAMVSKKERAECNARGKEKGRQVGTDRKEQ